MSRLTLFRASRAAETAYVPAQVTAGAPVARLRVQAATAADRVSAGTWTATCGAWSVSYAEWEFCHIVAGHARLHEAGQPAVDVGPGDAFVIAPGFAGVWEVVEPLVKHFVVIDPPL